MHTHSSDIQHNELISASSVLTAQSLCCQCDI